MSQSSTEAEYRSIAAVLADIIWLMSLLNELHIHPSLSKIYSDNLGAVLLSANPVMHSRPNTFNWICILFVTIFKRKKYL